MNDNLDGLLDKMRLLEKEMLMELGRMQTRFQYTIERKKVHFTDEARADHRKRLIGIWLFLLKSRLLVLLTTPFIWSVLLPISLLDLIVSIYQYACFPIYGIPKVPRNEYLLFDRHRLSYLNFIEKLNCEYCAYANGILAYTVEVAGRTEQYWCPIKHALRLKTMHSRYKRFFDYGDAEDYRERIEELRRSFEDVEK